MGRERCTYPLGSVDTNIPRFNTRAVYLRGPEEYPNAPRNRGAYKNHRRETNGPVQQILRIPPFTRTKKNSDIKDPNGTPETGKTTHKPKPNWRSDPFNPDHQRPSVVKNPS